MSVSRSHSSSPSATAGRPQFLSSDRYTFDHVVAATSSDARGAVSAGCIGGNTLVATAVRFTLPVDPGAVRYTVFQVSILAQARSAMSAGAMSLSLYSDDGATQPAPRMRVRTIEMHKEPNKWRLIHVELMVSSPCPCASQISSAALVVLSQRNLSSPFVWSALQAPTTWPVLLPGMSYWAVLAPGAALAAGDGATWAAFNASGGGAPPSVSYDAQLFTARQLRVTGRCSDASAIALLQGIPNWSSQGTSYTDWRVAGSVWRYGLSIIGTPLY